MTNAATLLLAARFAANRHHGQHRKGDLSHPYIEHLLEVASLLADPGGIGDPEILAAAVLHDTLEDTETTAAELRELFGERIASLVLEVTDDDGLPENVRRQRQIEHSPQLSFNAKLIKLADKISNVKDVTDHPPSDWPQEQRLEYIDRAERVVAGLRGVNPELEKYFDEAATRARAKFA